MSTTSSAPPPSPPQNHTLSEEELAACRKTANEAHGKGDFDTAIANQIKVVNHFNSQGTPDADAAKLLCLFFFSKQDFGAAAQVLLILKKQFPDDANNYENLGVVLRKLDRIPEAIVELEKAEEMAPGSSNVLDALAHSYGQIGEPEKCKAAGNRSLEIKHEASLEQGIAHPIPDSAPAPFDPAGNNVIAYSLWGNNPRYLDGAIRNAQLIPDIYPGWTCQIYHDDSVPQETLDELTALDAKLVSVAPPKNFYDGLFWRFLPATDPKVDRFLIRDIDSVVNVQERVAVDEWLDSDKYFHIMRDFYSHSELILAGMWGGVGGVLPPFEQLMKEFNPKIKATLTYDQLFLRLAIWPTIYQSLMSHDSCFDALGSIPFPKYGRLPADKHVGQNEAAVRKKKG